MNLNDTEHICIVLYPDFLTSDFKGMCDKIERPKLQHKLLESAKS